MESEIGPRLPTIRAILDLFCLKNSDMIGAIIGVATGLAGTAVSAGMGAAANARSRRQLEEREKRQAATYARRMNQDYTQRAESQRMLELTRQELKRRSDAAAGRQAVMGMTDSGMAAERELAGATMADTAAKIASQGEAKKEGLEDSYAKEQQANAEERAKLEGHKLTTIGNAVGGLINQVAPVAGAAIADSSWGQKMNTKINNWLDGGNKLSEGIKQAGKGGVDMEGVKDITIPEVGVDLKQLKYGDQRLMA